MAQAPQAPPASAPRTNKTVKEFKGMNTQNRRNAIPEGSFAWLENIQPIGPGHLHSIPGRSTSVVRIPPIIPPDLCTDATERGQQTIAIEDRFDQQNSFLPSTNVRTTWAYITSSEEVWSLMTDASCGGGNVPYDATCTQLNHWQSPLILTHPALIDPNPAFLAGGPKMGTSDQPVYGFASNSIGGAGLALYWPDLNNHTEYLMPTSFGYSGFEQQNFAVKGESVWITGINESNFGPNRDILEYNRSSGALLNRYTTVNNFFVRCPNLTDDFLYLLCTEVGNATNRSIKKLNRSDGTLAANFQIDDIGPFVMAVANDDLIYVLCFTTPASLYYVKNFNELVYVGSCTPLGFTPFGPVTATFINGSLYFGANGFSGFSTDIYRIAINCPEGSPPEAIVASANRGSASVAAGATINASWADVLEPNVGDEIQLRPAPTGGDLGFVGAALASQVTGGAGTDSIVFTIPALTTPGTYVFMYAYLGSVYVATSPTFTVT